MIDIQKDIDKTEDQQHATSLVLVLAQEYV